MNKKASSKVSKSAKWSVNNMKFKKALKSIENNLPEIYDKIESVLMETRTSEDRFDDDYAD